MGKAAAKATSKTTKTAGAVAAPKMKKKVKRHVTDGLAFVLSTFNNTIITITDVQGNTLTWSSAASCGYRGSRKSTPHAAGEAAQKAALQAIDVFGMKNVDVCVSGPGSGRESAIRALKAAGFNVKSIKDGTGTPHNGCRPPKKRRV